MNVELHAAARAGRHDPFGRRCKICRRIAASVFLGIVLIEAAILIPSYRNYERDLLAGLDMAGRNAARVVLNAFGAEVDAPPEVFDDICAGTILRGLTITFGSPERSPIHHGEVLQGLAHPDDHRLSRSRDGTRFETAWTAELQGAPVQLSARLDSSGVDRALAAFVWRIAGLVLLISLFVTAITMLVLGRILLRPVIDLRTRLLGAAGHPGEPLAFVRSGVRADELGDVDDALDQLLRHSAANLAALRDREQRLAQHAAELDRRVAERTAELKGINERLTLEVQERERAERELESVARFPAENSNPVLRVNGDGELIYANPGSATLLEAWGCVPGGKVPDSWRSVITAALASGLKKDTELEIGDRHYAFAITPLPDDGYVNLYAMDITQRKLFEQQLRHTTGHDGLTDLAKLPLFTDRLDQVLRRAAPVAVLQIALDDFKDVNAIASHAGGDRVLKATAARLIEVFGSRQSLARVGGDVFAAYTDGWTHPEEIAGLAEEAIAALRAPVIIDGEPISCSASIGVALHPADGDNAAELIRSADLALYRAKAEGKARYQFFEPQLTSAAVNRHRLLGELARALEQGDQLLLEYQPQVALPDRRIIGAEALLRWNHPERGRLAPGEFIDVAERSDQIVPLGTWVLREACRTARAWRQDHGVQLRIAVNLSAHQFQDPALLETVDRILEESELDGSALELEITEGVMMRDIGAAVDILQQLGARGVQLSIDDFGTGYSSLSYLRELPIDKLKIDRAFVTNVDTDANSASICQAIIAMGRSLGLHVIAEGVETDGQLQFLVDHECDEVQGFLTGRPMAADALLAAARAGDL